MNVVMLECFYKFLESVKSCKCEVYISALDTVSKLTFSIIVYQTSINKLF